MDNHWKSNIDLVKLKRIIEIYSEAIGQIL